MDLHRTTGRPDWSDVTADKRNPLQKVAAVTRGWVTPGNLITALGFSIVIAGLVYLLHGRYWLGFGLLIIGRLLDVADGWAAERTGTKSPLGESLDAGFDKLGTLLTIMALYASHIAAWWILLVILAPHLFIAGLTGLLLWKGKHVHPSRVGKLSMAAAWVSLVGLVALKASSDNSLLHPFVYLTIGLSFGMGAYAAYGYLRQND